MHLNTINIQTEEFHHQNHQKIIKSQIALSNTDQTKKTESNHQKKCREEDKTLLKQSKTLERNPDIVPDRKTEKKKNQICILESVRERSRLRIYKTFRKCKRKITIGNLQDLFKR